MKNPKFVIAGIALLILIILLVTLRNSDPQNVDPSSEDTNVIPVEDSPVDAVMDFYRPWLNANNDPETDPYTKGLATDEALTQAFQAKLAEAKSHYDLGINDPVLCTTVIPEGLRTKTVVRQADNAQILVLSREEVPRALAVVKLIGVNGEWNIDDVSCEAGETPPERGEFTFEKTGFLLGASVQPPLDPTKWYVVYERDGILGYTAVLNFSDASSCTDFDGSVITCEADFAEAMQVSVQGNMQETGVEVVNVNVVE